jgi:hypothetical protein
MNRNRMSGGGPWDSESAGAGGNWWSGFPGVTYKSSSNRRGGSSVASASQVRHCCVIAWTAGSLS